MAAVTHCNCEWGKYPVDLRMGVLNMLEKCDAACIKEMSHGNRRLEPPIGKQVPHDSRTVLKALPGKLDIKRYRHSPIFSMFCPNMQARGGLAKEIQQAKENLEGSGLVRLSEAWYGSTHLQNNSKWIEYLGVGPSLPLERINSCL